jgi:flagellar motor switch protein FliN/FliY
LDFLLDVEVPVSLSFGQARLPLRDVLKIAPGSVVELNRQPEEPVDIIINNTVVAQGEVVVVEGNYGVRIQKVLSRQQRLALRGGVGGIA